MIALFATFTAGYIIGTVIALFTMRKWVESKQ